MRNIYIYINKYTEYIQQKHGKNCSREGLTPTNVTQQTSVEH